MPGVFFLYEYDVRIFYFCFVEITIKDFSIKSEAIGLHADDDVVRGNQPPPPALHKDNIEIPVLSEENVAFDEETEAPKVLVFENKDIAQKDPAKDTLTQSMGDNIETSEFSKNDITANVKTEKSTEKQDTVTNTGAWDSPKLNAAADQNVVKRKSPKKKMV